MIIKRNIILLILFMLFYLTVVSSANSAIINIKNGDTNITVKGYLIESNKNTSTFYGKNVICQINMSTSELVCNIKISTKKLAKPMLKELYKEI